MYLTLRFYTTAVAVALLIAAGYWWHPLYVLGIAALVALAVLWLADFAMLWHRRGIEAERECSDRFSNGDENEVRLNIDSRYPFAVRLNVVDEVPFVFQRRDVSFRHKLQAGGACGIIYRLRPTERGVYGFGKIRVFATTVIGLNERRYTCGEPVDVKVYPSYLMLNRYEILAMSNNLSELGIKRIRRVGNNTEFEQIKDYVQGDDFRTINWKATARRNQLMINLYRDERSQQIINVIDKGRVMQQAFDNMTLLDYAINASLVLSYVAVKKDDKAGLITFNEEFRDFVQPNKSPGQMQTILETLYAQETDFGESDFSSLLLNVNRLVRKRSLLVLYTNFIGLNSLHRQLPYLRQLNRQHRLLVVFFADSQLQEFIASKANDTEEYFQQVIAEKTEREKELIVSTLRRQGILSLLTTPRNLSVNVINSYLDLKARQMF